MKNSISVLIILILFQSCAKESNTDTTIDLIKKVETGLTTRVHIAGDSTWSIEERMKHYGIPGVSIAVIHNGEIAWTKAYGVMDKESQTPVTTQTLFQAAATSMPVTAYGALRLVEQHKLGLDEDINSYLKSWKQPENEFTKEDKVTLRNLLNHSAGIYPRGTGSYSINEKIPTLVEILNGTPPASNEPITVNKKPGESVRFAYASYVPIQQMMLDVEGETFPEIMHELVLQPLEMNNSTFNQALTSEQLTKVATGYLQDGSMVKGGRNIQPAMASGGLWTTAEDYAKFITNIQQTLKGKRTKGLSKDLTELMGTPYGVGNSGWSYTLGLGFQLLNRNDDIYLRHHGWNTGFYAEILAHRDKGYGVVVMTNSTFPEFNAEVMRSVAQAYGWDNYVPVHQKMEIEPSSVVEITGRYQSDDVIVEIFQKGSQLFYKNILDEQGVELIKVSDSLFVRRNSSRFIQFKPGSENGVINLQYLNRNDGAIISSLAKVASDEKSPVEFLLEGDFENALIAYKNLMELDPTHPTVSEGYINDIGYDFYHADRMTLSLNTFKVNMMLYPDSYKVYDSYAKACMKTGDIDLAILNYSKSLELNPQNNRARSRLVELQKMGAAINMGDKINTALKENGAHVTPDGKY
ncbi:MAG: serine hydrolase [Cellulophaga sp.]